MDKLQADKLTEIRKALEAATPGPWRERMEDCGGESDDEWYRTIEAGKGFISADRVLDTGFGMYGFIAPENAHLIAHAPEYITYLLQLVDTQAQALGLIADYEVVSDHGYVDEWTEAMAFSVCQNIARQALTQV